MRCLCELTPTLWRCRCWGENGSLQQQFLSSDHAYDASALASPPPQAGRAAPGRSPERGAGPSSASGLSCCSPGGSDHSSLLPSQTGVPGLGLGAAAKSPPVASRRSSALPTAPPPGRHRFPGHPLGLSLPAASHAPPVALADTSTQSAGAPLLPQAPPPHGPVPEPRVVASLAGIPIVSVAAGEGHLVAMSAAGRVYTWGSGQAGACGQRSMRPVWLPHAVDLEHADGGDGAVAAAGRGGRGGAPAAAARAPAAAAGTFDGEAGAHFDDRLYACVGLGLARGIVTHPERLAVEQARPLGYECLPAPPSEPSAPPPHPSGSGTTPSPSPSGLAANTSPPWTAVGIAAGAHHTVVLTQSGRAVSFGWAQHGRLGTGSDEARAVPAPTVVKGMPTLVGVACGYRHTLLLAADGRVYATGSNSCGQLGVHPGEAAQRRRPPAAALAAAARGAVLPLLRPANAPTAAGAQGRALWTTPDDLDSCAAVGAAERLVPLPSCALRPQQVVGPAFQNAIVASIAAGGNCSSCIDATGRLWMWGWAEDGNGGSGADRDAWNPRLAERFANVRALQVRLRVPSSFRPPSAPCSLPRALCSCRRLSDRRIPQPSSPAASAASSAPCSPPRASTERPLLRRPFCSVRSCGCSRHARARRRSPGACEPRRQPRLPCGGALPASAVSSRRRLRGRGHSQGVAWPAGPHRGGQGLLCAAAAVPVWAALSAAAPPSASSTTSATLPRRSRPRLGCPRP